MEIDKNEHKSLVYFVEAGGRELVYFPFHQSFKITVLEVGVGRHIWK